MRATQFTAGQYLSFPSGFLGLTNHNPHGLMAEALHKICICDVRACSCPWQATHTGDWLDWVGAARRLGDHALSWFHQWQQPCCCITKAPACLLLLSTPSANQSRESAVNASHRQLGSKVLMTVLDLSGGPVCHLDRFYRASQLTRKSYCAIAFLSDCTGQYASLISVRA